MCLTNTLVSSLHGLASKKITEMSGPNDFTKCYPSAKIIIIIIIMAFFPIACYSEVAG